MRKILFLLALLVCTPAQAAFNFSDLACETTTTTGTGTLSLAGAASNYLSFLTAGIASGDTVPYQIKASDGKFETGIGTFTDATPDTLARTTVKYSSDGAGTALTLPAGTHTVCIGPIASIWLGGNTWTLDLSTSGVVKTGTIELGAATDTTVARQSAGHLSVESNKIWDAANFKESFIIAASDETTAITTGTAKVTFRMPYAFTVTEVRCSLTTASSSGAPVIDIKESGTSIMTTNKCSIDANETTSTTAATPPGITDSALADDAEMTIDVNTAGTGAKGLKVEIIGHQ